MRQDTQKKVVDEEKKIYYRLSTHRRSSTRKVQRHFCVDFSCVMLVYTKKKFLFFSISVSKNRHGIGQCQNLKLVVGLLRSVEFLSQLFFFFLSYFFFSFFFRFRNGYAENKRFKVIGITRCIFLIVRKQSFNSISFM